MPNSRKPQGQQVGDVAGIDQSGGRVEPLVICHGGSRSRIYRVTMRRLNETMLQHVSDDSGWPSRPARSGAESSRSPGGQR